MTQRIVVLISGSGSNLQTLIDHSLKGDLHGDIVGVISNKADAFGLVRAENANIPNMVLDHKMFESREDFDLALIEQIDSFKPDLVVLAGFMRILSEEFVSRYQGRLMNIHPSLLPRYKGLNTHQRALDAGDAEHGCSVHFVTEELDGGPIIIQAKTPILMEDDSASLQARVHTLEHKIYPLAVSWFCSGRLRVTVDGVMLDDNCLPSSGFELKV
ncbi:phosphoribosylglycinamide formyltransferase [Nitrincola tibetensis]|uniref:Phosphoribosylglycinamide formyltransferase n=1 Tax=Nitrincola tibetensis TaxID=2219697 RepID=A0A364NMY5_9GAMM|nr:phosphoribosylglycinamide formyltransferase [Nitrincola tibetensis]RAU18443.1 phosphoribosylglycinamide formyltransferase [Nitrincola tibetensis]